MSLSPTSSEAPPRSECPRAFRICVTGAAGNIAYVLLSQLVKLALAPQVELFLLDIPPAMEQLRGVVMELEDSSLPPLKSILATDLPRLAFQHADLVILLGSSPRKPGQEIPDLLENNIMSIREQARLIDQIASKHVKVLMVGNPCNTNAWVCKQYAPSIPTKNFTATTRLDWNRAVSFVAAQLGVNVRQVKNLIIWGNHSSQNLGVDTAHAVIADYPVQGQSTPLDHVLKAKPGLKDELVQFIRSRSSALLLSRSSPAKLSCAAGVLDHLRDWFHGTNEGEFVSMIVESDGSYGVPEGMMFSMPVTCKDGEFSIVRGLSIDDDMLRVIEMGIAELVTEKERADVALAQ